MGKYSGRCGKVAFKNYKMKNIVSVIVPTRNSAEYIEECLNSIIHQTYKEIELIVVDNNSTDDTKKISKKFTPHVYNKGPERSAQRNFGAKKASGKYVVFIDSDMMLDNNVVKECVERITNCKGIIIPEISVGNSFWAKCKALERSFYLGVDWIEAARFFEKKTFDELKGYDENQTGTEDFDLPQRIKKKYGESSIVRIKSFIYHDEGNLSLIYTLKKKHYYAKTIQQYSANTGNADYFKKQANPLNRYALFFSSPAKLVKNPIVGAGMLFMKTAEFAAGGLGYINKKNIS